MLMALNILCAMEVFLKTLKVMILTMVISTTEKELNFIRDVFSLMMEIILIPYQSKKLMRMEKQMVMRILFKYR